MKWCVKNFNMNSQRIEDIDILKYREDDIKKLKKKCSTKAEFAKELKSYICYYFWARSEWELIIEITEDNRITLTPWCGCYKPKETIIDVTDNKNFDWLGFAKKHVGEQVYDSAAKIDVADQIFYVWDEFVTYCWE